MRAAAVAAVLALAPPAGAQDGASPTAGAPAPAEDPALARARAEFEAGAKAYELGDYAAARARYTRALEGLPAVAPGAAAARSALEIALQRAVAWSFASQGAPDGFRSAARAAWALALAAGGNATEERYVEQAGAFCAERLTEPEARLRFLQAWRADLEALVPNPPPPGSLAVSRLRRQIGQLWHEQAAEEERAGRLEACAETLRRAIAYRSDADDILGTGWSSHARFMVLLRLDRDAEAAAQFGHTAAQVARGAGLAVEAALCGNVERWLAQRVAAGQHARAVALLAAVRASGALGDVGLSTLPLGRLLQMEWELRVAGGPPDPAETELLARALLAAADAEGQPAWAYLGASSLADRALAGSPPRPDAAEEHGRTALAAAKALLDPERAAKAQLLIARARAAAGDLTAAETVVRAVFTAYGAEGADRGIRESARRVGAALAQRAENADWAASYAFGGQVQKAIAAEGHTWLGADIREFLQAIAQCSGDGAVLTVTRRGRYFVLRSPFLVGAQAIEWGWHLKYVNANGILLAIQGPEVAVVGQRPEPTAPSAKGGAPALADGGLDLDTLRGPALPPLAPRVVLRDGETAFVNRFLRIHR